MGRRPRAADCERLTVGDLRPLVEPGADHHRLADGTELALGWRPVQGCFGGRGGRALLAICPICTAEARVLWRPPGSGWGCWRCHPISHPSHRRSGSRAGRPKPPRWERQRIGAEQCRIADLLGLTQWPPERLLWDWRTLLVAPRWPDAPELSVHRELALCRRACALETLRVGLFLPSINAELGALGKELPPWPGMAGQVAAAHRVLATTRWAMRRPAGDPRSRKPDARSAVAPTTDGIASKAVCDCYTSEIGQSALPAIAIRATTDSVITAA